MALLEVKDLEVNYGFIKAIKGVSFEVNEGEVVALIGANGAGKTTIMHAINGLIPKHAGSVTFDGQDITDLSADKRAAAGLFMSFQNPLEVPGLSMESFLRNAIRQRTGKPIKILTFKRELEETMEQLLFPVPVQIRPKTLPQMPGYRQAEQDSQNNAALEAAGTEKGLGISIHGSIDNTPGTQSKHHAKRRIVQNGAQ